MARVCGQRADPGKDAEEYALSEIEQFVIVGIKPQRSYHSMAIGLTYRLPMDIRAQMTSRTYR
jgi:hypothetical protein